MDKIKTGDIVTIFYNDGGCLKNAKVVHVPSDVGDMWYFEGNDGDIFAQNPLSSNLDYIRKTASATEP